MANYKAIVIDTKTTPNGMAQEWTDVTTLMPTLTRDINTPALKSESDLTAVVSGMPTVFARANLFKLAIAYTEKPDADRSEAEGLLNYYKNLVDEWRGFIACIALDYTRISVRRIRLAYSDGKGFADTKNIYEPKGAFGNVLFERRLLWSEQGIEAHDSAPFIDVISYDGKVVGAVSPESLLFTSPGYRVTDDHPFINKTTGKFTDPLHNALPQAQALTLLAYVEYVENKINELGRYYEGISDETLRPNYNTAQSNIRRWKAEIEKYCNDRGFAIDAKSIPPVQNFQSPYSLVFNYSSKLYGLEGIIYDDESLAPDNKIFFDPKNILLPKTSEIARIDFSNGEIVRNPKLLEEQPVYVLKAQIKGKGNEYAYFALPITPLGLNVFGKNIGALTGIDSNNAISSKLTAEFDPERPTDNLEVVLEITTQSNKRRELKESGYLVIRYTTSDSNGNLPRNELLVPRDLRTATVGVDFGSTNTSVAYSVDGKLKGVHFQNHRVSLLQAGSRATCKERDLFIFQSKEIEGNAVKSILTLNDQRRLGNAVPNAEAREVSGGMPCFDPSLLPVENVTDNRIVLKCLAIGDVYLVHNMKWTTQPSDVANKKAFLRALMLHVYAQLFTEGCVPDVLKWSYPSAMDTMLVNQYSQIWDDLGVGLCPVKGKNLTICSSDIAGPIDAAPGGIFNTGGFADGSGFGSSFGGGFEKGASMSFGASADGGGFGSGFTFGAEKSQPGAASLTFGHDTPAPGKTNVEDLEPDSDEVKFDFKETERDKCMTEAAAVANFNGTRTDFSHDVNTLTLCFDVGGSTTDISAIIYTREGVKLLKQNSIRFAAQQVSSAARCEVNLKRVLLDICTQNAISIPGLNFGPDRFSPDTASFYFEQVLDRLPTEKLADLYRMLNSNCHRLMSVNLYVTGLVLYYAGQLTHKLGKVIRKSLGAADAFYAGFRPVVNVMFAGKGSRIFEWFSTTQYDAATSYYQQMFVRGYGGMAEAGASLQGLNIQMAHDVSPDVKYEVSKGLALEPIHGILVPKAASEAVEIIGEDNFEIIRASNGERVPLQFDNAITPKMMEQISINMVEKQPAGGQPFACTRFVNFAELFYAAAKSLFGLTLAESDFMQGFRNMNISSYIQNLPEYRRAREVGRSFDYVAPIIIIEGMKFYNDVLLQKL